MIYFNSQRWINLCCLPRMFCPKSCHMYQKVPAISIIPESSRSTFSLCSRDLCYEASSSLLGAALASSPIQSSLFLLKPNSFSLCLNSKSSCWTKGLENSEETFDKRLDLREWEWGGRSEREKGELAESEEEEVPKSWRRVWGSISFKIPALARHKGNLKHLKERLTMACTQS